MRQDPDYIVADKIIEQIKNKYLIPDYLLNSFKTKLLSGQLKPEDWISFAKLSLPKDNQDE